MILEKLQSMSPRARCAVSSAEVQTLFSKMETFTSALSTPGQARMLLDIASMPLGYFFLYRLYGVPAIAVSIVANIAITALTARMTTQKSRSEAKLRELSKQQESILHELAGNLPIWKFYGWSHFFIAKLCVQCRESCILVCPSSPSPSSLGVKRTDRRVQCSQLFCRFMWPCRDSLALEMERVGRWTATWQTIAWVLPSSIGPTAVLISVGINVLLGERACQSVNCSLASPCLSATELVSGTSAASILSCRRDG